VPQDLLRTSGKVPETVVSADLPETMAVTDCDDEER